MGTDRYTVHRQDDGSWAVVYRGTVYALCKNQRVANKLAQEFNDKLEQERYARKHDA
jgi:phosphoglucomutase